MELIKSPVHFKDLKRYNDSNSFVILALLINEESEVEDMNRFFHEDCGLLPEGKNIVGVRHILDNKLGSEGRSDYLIELTDDGKIANPMVRMQLRMQGFGVVWTSDFIDNYKGDYRG